MLPEKKYVPKIRLIQKINLFNISDFSDRGYLLAQKCINKSALYIFDHTKIARVQLRNSTEGV